MIEVLSTLFSCSFMMRGPLRALVALLPPLLGRPVVLKCIYDRRRAFPMLAFRALSVATALNFAPMAVADAHACFSRFLLLRISGSGRIIFACRDIARYFLLGVGHRCHRHTPSPPVWGRISITICSVVFWRSAGRCYIVHRPFWLCWFVFVFI